MPSTVNPTLVELVSLLGKFPRGVIPGAVMQAIMSRNEAANEVLLSRLNIAVDNAAGGLGTIPSESFFCFALLHNSPAIGMVPALERLFELEEAISEKFFGELRYGFTTSLFVRMSNPNTIDTLRSWVDEAIQNSKIDHYIRWNLVSVIPHWVSRGLMTREAGIAQLKCWLEQRSDESYDELSSGILCELLTLKAIEERSFLELCFERGQIDESIVSRKYGLSELDDGKPHRGDLDERLQSNDLIGYFGSWHGFPKLSRSLDPRDPNLEEREYGINHDSFRSEEADRWFAAIRGSNDSKYPHEAIRSLIHHASKLNDRLVEEVR